MCQGSRGIRSYRPLANEPYVKPKVKSVNVFRRDYESIPIQTFRDQAFTPEKPLLFEATGPFAAAGLLPACTKWFEPIKNDRMRPVRKVLTEAMQPFMERTVPYELEYPQFRPIYGEAVGKFIESLKSGAENGTPALDAELGQFLETQIPPDFIKTGVLRRQVLRFHAPLALLSTAMNYNMAKAANAPLAGLRKLHIAQAPLEDFPKEMQADVPVPRIVKLAGKGDIYASSLWLGLEQTYTPLHRDPNPNLFVQLCSTKEVRLLPPASGDEFFRAIQRHLGNPIGNSTIRGMEMMDGPEADLTFQGIWRDRNFGAGMSPQLRHELAAHKTEMLEATLEPGDALFIPKGWWHSVRSLFADGRLNGSVNWWFR